MMKRFPLLDAVIGLLLTLLVALSYLLTWPLLESVELKAYDMRSKLRQTLDPTSEVVLISIDDASISQLGRWPWPRSRIAGMLDKLTAAKPKVIGLNILFSEPEQNQGLIELKNLEAKYHELVASRKISEKKGTEFVSEFSSAAVRLDTDSKLLASLQAAHNVVLPMYFSLGGIFGAKPEELPAAISSSAVTAQVVQGGPEAAVEDGSKATYPIVPFAEAALGVGHANSYPDFDGVLRREFPVVKYGNSYYPSYAVQLMLAFMGLKPSDVTITPGRQLQVGRYAIPLDRGNGMLISFNGPDQTFRYYPFQDVMNDKVSMDVFKDKIVIVGPTAVGVGTLYVTPVAHNFPSIEIIANVIENIRNQKFLHRPPWAMNLELGLIALVGLFIMLGLPRLKALWGAVISLLLLVAMTGAGTFFFVNGEWVKTTYPCVLLALGYLVITSRRFFGTEKGKELVEASAIETNKMLGLSFQGQGMLDMAFEKFRLCPLDDNMKDTLYNLALDFERKRQYSKALSVLGHIAAKEPKFKDIEPKMAMLKQASEGAVFGGVGVSKKEGTVMLSGGATKPTLGRYEIEKELGRGAMGIVYLGKDPKINRLVAIKTMMLDDGSDAASTKEIKERFFREAESAGTLNHPNIVRIFDAGEEQDVSYIAMELLDGKDLVEYTGKDKLLPPEQAMEYVAIVADALDYAHAQGIVHRDIKPANIMLLKNGTIRVADFGIARITASSKTATGTVMGTPSYMSPEQVAGKKVDGRADLFSLTVALYEFLTGEKPFKGGDGIGTLLFQIANDPHPDPIAVNPRLPPCVKTIIDKGLAKNPDQRYARGSELAAALRACSAALRSGSPAPAVAEPTIPVPMMEPLPAVPVPVAATPATPEKPLPSLDFLAPVQAPAQPSPDATLKMGQIIEMPQRSGVHPAPSPEETLRINPPLEFESSIPESNVPSSPDATIRLTPPPKEPNP